MREQDGAAGVVPTGVLHQAHDVGLDRLTVGQEPHQHRDAALVNEEVILKVLHVEAEGVVVLADRFPERARAGQLGPTKPAIEPIPHTLECDLANRRSAVVAG